MSSSYESADLLMKLYDLRREPVLRESRRFLTAADLSHPTLHRVPFTRDGWLCELKHDGFRALVVWHVRSPTLIVSLLDHGWDANRGRRTLRMCHAPFSGKRDQPRVSSQKRPV